MSTTHLLSRRLERLAPGRTTLLWGTILVNAELVLVAAYLAQPSVRAVDLVQYVYPFVWINVALWALWRTWPAADATPRRRLAAAGLAGLYFLVLAYAGGLVGPGHELLGHTGHVHAASLRIADLPPGWGPAPVYGGPLLSVVLMPFKVLGYVALAYLVYATVLDAAGTAIGGVLGVLSCVSCTWPVLATLVGGVAGGTGLAAAVSGEAYGISTVVFVLTVGLLVWRPFGD